MSERFENRTRGQATANGPYPHKRDRDRIRAQSAISNAAMAPGDQTKDDEIKLAKAFQKVFSTPEGRQVFEHITIGLCQIDAHIVAPSIGSTEMLIARCTAFDIGREIERLALLDIGEKRQDPKVITDE